VCVFGSVVNTEEKAKNTANQLMFKKTTAKLSDRDEALLTVRFWQW